MILRNVPVASGILLCFVLLTYIYSTATITSKSTMATLSKSDIPITITLSALSPPDPETLKLRVSLHNTSPTSSVYLLHWSTPLDPLGPAEGIFQFTSLRTSLPLPSLDLKPNRKVPENGIFKPQDDEITRLATGEVAEREVLIKAHEIPFRNGEKYAVKVGGTWLGVWLKEMEGGGLSLEDGKGVLRGVYESDTIEVKVPD